MAGSPGPQALIEGRDYYFDSSGLMVLTAHFLWARGFCCDKGCRHCPYRGQEEGAPPALDGPP